MPSGREISLREGKLGLREGNAGLWKGIGGIEEGVISVERGLICPGKWERDPFGVMRGALMMSA
jgi:hypothetical protein